MQKQSSADEEGYLITESDALEDWNVNVTYRTQNLQKNLKSRAQRYSEQIFPRTMMMLHTEPRKQKSSQSWSERQCSAINTCEQKAISTSNIYEKKLIFMSEQSSTDYNEHGMKPELPGQTILLLLLILYQVLEAALAMLYCLLLALPHAAVPKTATKKSDRKRGRER